MCAFFWSSKRKGFLLVGCYCRRVFQNAIIEAHSTLHPGSHVWALPLSCYPLSSVFSLDPLLVGWPCGAAWSLKPEPSSMRSLNSLGAAVFEGSTVTVPLLQLNDHHIYRSSSSLVFSCLILLWVILKLHPPVMLVSDILLHNVPISLFVLG